MQNINQIEEVCENDDIMTLYISDPLEITSKFLGKLKLDEAIQFVNYMNKAHCSYAIMWIPRKEVFEELSPQSKKSYPSIREAPIAELKPLSKDLKYAFLRLKEIFPVIISTYLEENQEKYLLYVQRNFGVKYSGIKNMDDVKCIRQMQYRISPAMKEVVKVEVLKLLNTALSVK